MLRIWKAKDGARWRRGDGRLCSVAEGKLAKSRHQLEPLESGRVHFGTRPFGGRWEDITLREIRRVKANIAELEALILKYSS